MSMIVARAPSAVLPAAPLEAFVACAHQMLDPTTPEAARRAMEPRVLALLPALRALGVFELFELRDPALRTWLQDEMAEPAK
ncbi:hypothetical protein [Dyella sp. 20L07]|uniref:hypothetical protein n=1 Tax=Dyella sp. 20L07 TaxID=3384240 RepID=UPI003D2CA53C